eukprot:970016-Rhodomonas_salina.1
MIWDYDLADLSPELSTPAAWFLRAHVSTAHRTARAEHKSRRMLPACSMPDASTICAVSTGHSVGRA